jgi:hypothetical protein
MSKQISMKKSKAGRERECVFMYDRGIARREMERETREDMQRDVNIRRWV